MEPAKVSIKIQDKNRIKQLNIKKPLRNAAGFINNDLKLDSSKTIKLSVKNKS